MKFTPIGMLAMLTFFGASTSYAESPPDSEAVLQRLQGTWNIDEGVNQGEEVSEEELEGTTMVVKEHVIVSYDKEKNETYRATFTIDASERPIQIDLVSKMKDGRESTALGILRFEEEDEFELAYALPGAERPNKFESPKGSKIMLFELEQDD